MNLAIRLFLGVVAFGVATAPAVAASMYRLPDFNGRDRAYVSVRDEILKGLEQAPNFAGNYSVIQVACGTGCASNFLVDRLSGRVTKAPYGSESMQLRSLRYGRGSNLMSAVWLHGDTCLAQQAKWNGAGFVFVSRPARVAAGRCLARG